MRTHVKVISWIDVILGALTVLGGLASLTGTFSNLLIIGIGVLGIVVGIKLQEYRNWARIAQITFGVLQMVVLFPVGTIFGVYCLWAMLSEDGRALFTERTHAGFLQRLRDRLTKRATTHKWQAEGPIKDLLKNGDYLAALGLDPSASNPEILIAIVRSSRAYPDLQPLFNRAQKALINQRARYEKIRGLCAATKEKLAKECGRDVLSLIDESRERTLFELMDELDGADEKRAFNHIHAHFVEGLPELELRSPQVSRGRAEVTATRDGSEYDLVFSVPAGVKIGWVLRAKGTKGVVYVRVTAIKEPGQTSNLFDGPIDIDDEVLQMLLKRLR